MTNETPDQSNSKRPASEPHAAQKLVGPAFAEPEEPITDLCGEILKVLPRSRGERVTCRRITGNHYRCNWWAPSDTENFDNPAMTGLTVTTHRVARSELLHVTKTAARLEIKAVRAR